MTLKEFCKNCLYSTTVSIWHTPSGKSITSKTDKILKTKKYEKVLNHEVEFFSITIEESSLKIRVRVNKEIK